MACGRLSGYQGYWLSAFAGLPVTGQVAIEVFHRKIQDDPINRITLLTAITRQMFPTQGVLIAATEVTDNPALTPMPTGGGQRPLPWGVRLDSRRSTPAGPN